MKAITGLVVVLLATLPCPAQQSSQKAETKDKTPDYYPLKVGSKRHYLVEVGNGRKVVFLYQITKIENIDGKRLARVEMVVNGEIKTTEYIGIDAGGVFRYRTNDVAISPPECILKYPVKEGDTWTAEMKTGDQPGTMTAKTGKKEEVRVPAGKYEAISVTTEMTSAGSRVRIISWFAPEVGIVKQSIEIKSGHIPMELFKFEPGE
jgi:hypothetical protein